MKNRFFSNIFIPFRFEFPEDNPHKNARPIVGIVQSNGCVWCISHKTKDGKYPRVSRYGKDYRLHRWIFKKYNQDIPEGMVIRHECHNTFCINPDHLELGTQGDNMRDKVLSGRQPRGSVCKSAKLNEEQVYEIRFSSEGKTVKELAEEYGVSGSTIRSIKKRKSWMHVVEHKIIAA
ncbi:MAG: HNH endonuclease [Melioribacteraceae bacterium]|nr:HNH endonuclease [Melioribacteraceae bacterium]